MNKNIEKIIARFSADTKRLLKDNLIAEYLFGSTAREDNTALSDIDILIPDGNDTQCPVILNPVVSKSLIFLNLV